jgi:hypothetical protein
VSVPTIATQCYCCGARVTAARRRKRVNVPLVSTITAKSARAAQPTQTFGQRYGHARGRLNVRSRRTAVPAITAVIVS